MLSPVAAALSLIEAPGFGVYRLLPAAWWVAVAGVVLSLALLFVQTRRLTRPE